MRRRKLLTGQRFGKLLIIQEGEKPINGQYYCLALCDCGNVTRTMKGHFNAGHAKSCGCVIKANRKLYSHLSITKQTAELHLYGLQRQK